MYWPIVIAESAWEAIIWMVLGLLWFIAQIAARSRKAGAKRPAPKRAFTPTSSEPAPTEATPKELEEFLRALGMETPMPAVREPEPATPPAPVVRTRKRPRRAAPAMEKAPPPSPPVSSAALAPRVEGAERSIERLRTMMVIPKLTGLRMRPAQLPLVALQGRGAAPQHNIARRMGLGGRRAVRQAMRHRLILEPPHAFKY